MTSLEGPNGKVDVTGQKAAIDSGTSLIVGAKAVIDPLIEGITVNQDCSGIESLPSVFFTFDDTTYELTYNDYVVKVEQFGAEECVMGIMSMDVPEGFNYVIVGDVFFRPYAPYFNLNDNTVTFFKKN